MLETEAQADQVRDLGRLWWLPVALGALSIIVGAVVLAEPGNSLKAFAVITGIFLLLDGIVELVGALGRDTANRGLVLLLGVLNLIVGILLIRHPIGGVQAIALFLGIYLIAAGMVRLVMAADRAGGPGRFVFGAIEALFGVAIVANPHIGFTTLAIIVGISFIVTGISMIAFGSLLRTVRRDKGGRPRVRERPRPARTSR